MRMHSAFVLAALSSFALGTEASRGDGPNLGRPINAADIAAWDIDIEPDGAGLPAGSGTADQGATIFADNCANSGAPAAPAVVDDRKIAGIDEATTTIANYWPYATTLFDYIRRAMPWTAPRSMTDDQVYALTAYILAQNKLIDAKDVINAQTLPRVQMPNRNGFIPRFPERMPR
jgi:S-disulfanyl-L-cysteine oxidoreductase SoxD